MQNFYFYINEYVLNKNTKAKKDKDEKVSFKTKEKKMKSWLRPYSCKMCIKLNYPKFQLSHESMTMTSDNLTLRQSPTVLRLSRIFF